MPAPTLTRRTGTLAAVGAAAAVLFSGVCAGGQSAEAAQSRHSAQARVACTGADTAVRARAVSRPIDHLLITVTNTGRKTCDLYGYPAVRLGDAQAVPPAIEESKPQAVTTLRPGRSGYAAVILSSGDGSGSHGYTATTLTVFFQNRDLRFAGAGSHVRLPRRGVHVDDTVRVTYWESDPQTALTW